ncbi:DNA polymerase III subunit gamma and tau [Nocardia carnea]|uniref:DNA polymerase III subunit gamma and tau n=1 Tax=Nocardia carnea TaxID=37328 RepID=UPI002457C4FE|nr:DNA polymerase III subunit gamma and tau [Nocardia carnea]
MALYRKYRPATFADVVGQEHVTDPLCTALDTGRISHAYLFSGPRGCGKTSSARILARSLNCVDGPTSTPCGTCASCVSLAPGGGGNLDVIELDAASHGGVDDTRELRDRAFYAPAESRYRVFIVDEAHMVTTAGFNALLKIVEEPPAHLIFVFATTEPEKVLPTIRSRTHHYPFRLLPPATMRGLLGDICAQEHVPVEEAVYPLVIRAGGGSPRDSLSVLDQLLAGAGSDGVTYARAVALLGVTDVALIDDAIDALAAGDGAALFGTVDRVMEAGHDPRRFAVDLLERLRDLILMQAVPDATERGLVAAPGDLLDRMRAQAARLGPATLTRCAELLHAGLGEMRGATAPRLLLEVVCSRMLLPAADTSDAATLQRLEQLERRVSSGAAVAPADAAAAPSGGVPPAPARPAADPSRRRGAEALAALRESKAHTSGASAAGASPSAHTAGPSQRQAESDPRHETTAAAQESADAPAGSEPPPAPAAGPPPDRSRPTGALGVDSAESGSSGLSQGVSEAGDNSPAADPGDAGSADTQAATGVDNGTRSPGEAGPGTRAVAQAAPDERNRSSAGAGAESRQGARASADDRDRAPASEQAAAAGPRASAGEQDHRPAGAGEEGRAGEQAATAGGDRTDIGSDADIQAATPGSDRMDSGSEVGVRASAGDRNRPAAGTGAHDRPLSHVASGDHVDPGVPERNRPGASASGGVGDREGAATGADADRPAADDAQPRAAGSTGPARPAGVESAAEWLAAVEAAWADIKVKVREFGPTIGAMLTSGASVAGVEQGEIVLAHHAALVQRLSQPQPMGAVRSAVAAVLGHERPVRWVVAGQQVSRGPGGRERGGRRSGDSDSGDSEAGRRGGPRRTWNGRPGAGDGDTGPGESRGPEAAGPAVATQAGTGSGEGGPNRAVGASGRRAAAPRFSRPSQARGAGAAAGDPGPAGSGNPGPAGGGNPYDDIPPPDYPDLPDDPGPDDYGYGSGAVPPSTPEEEQEMLADAAQPVDPAQRRDPDEVALELLASELGATPLNG